MQSSRPDAAPDAATTTTIDPLDAAIAATPESSTAEPDAAPVQGLVPARLTDVDDESVTVRFRLDGTDHTTRARALCALDAGDVGAEVVLQFERGDLRRPFVLGVVDPRAHADAPAAGRQVVEADGELEMRCGKASLTLREDGKIVLRGTHVVSRASAVNRIKGGAVHIN